MYTHFILLLLAAHTGLTAKCKPYQCYYTGTRISLDSTEYCSESYCEQTSKRCLCEPHVLGKSCDECQDGFYDVASGEGCYKCNCDPLGSVHFRCNQFSGQCKCKEGFNGLRCDKCEAHYFLKSFKKCVPCECNPYGSISLQCDSTGQCLCTNFAKGQQCNKCEENKYNLKNGCVDCPPCYKLVQDAHKNLTDKIADVRHILNEINVLIPDYDEDFGESLKNVRNKIKQLHGDAIKALADDKMLSDKLRDMTNGLQDLNNTLNNLENKFEQIEKILYKSKNDTEQTNKILKQANSTLNEATNNFLNATEALEQAWNRSQYISDKSDEMKNLAEEAIKLSDILEKNATILKTIASSLQTTSEEINNRYEGFYKNVTAFLNRTSEDIDKISKELSEAEKELKNYISNSNDLLNKTTKELENASAILKQAQNISFPSLPESHLNETRTLLDEILTAKSVSTISEVENLTIRAEKALFNARKQQEITNRLLNDAKATDKRVDNAIKLVNEIFKNAQDVYKTLSVFDKQIQSSKAVAVEAISQMPEIEVAIKLADSKTKRIKEILGNIFSNLNETTNKTQQILNESNQSINESNALQADAARLKSNLMELNVTSDELTKNLTLTEERINTFEKNIEEEEKLLSSAKNEINKTQNDILNTTAEIAKLMSELDAILKEIDEISDLSETKLDDFEMLLMEAEDEVQKIDLNEKLLTIQKVNDDQNRLIGQYEDEIGFLRKEVENVKQIKESLPNGCYRRKTIED